MGKKFWLGRNWGGAIFSEILQKKNSTGGVLGVSHFSPGPRRYAEPFAMKNRIFRSAALRAAVAGDGFFRDSGMECLHQRKMAAANGAIEAQLVKSAAPNRAIEAQPAKSAAANGAIEAQLVKSAAANGVIEAQPVKSGAPNGAIEAQPVKSGAPNGAIEAQPVKSGAPNGAIEAKAYETFYLQPI